MTTYSGRTMRFSLTRYQRSLLRMFSQYVSIDGTTGFCLRIPASVSNDIRAAQDLVRYGLARCTSVDGMTSEFELTSTGCQAWRDLDSGVQEVNVTVTVEPEAPVPATSYDPVARRIEALGMFVEHYGPDGALSYRLLDTPNARMRQEIDRLRRDGLTVHHYDRHTGWTGLILTRPHGMRLRHELIGEPEGPLARSRRGTETPAHMQRYQLTETDVSILERFITIPTPNGSIICRYSVPFDQAATIQPMLNLMRLGLVAVMEVSGSHHTFELTETGHHIRDLARRNPGSPVFVAEPGAVEFKFTEEEAKPTPPQSATQPQRRLRNSRKKG